MISQQQVTEEFREAKARRILVDNRYLLQNARKSITTVHDALVELITNADDSYQRARKNGGRIEIEIERRRGSNKSEIRVRDYAEGMTLRQMEAGLSQYGRRVSGLERGENVRGTNSRGAKDIVNLGEAEFRSIAKDGKYHSSKITHDFRFIPGEIDLDVENQRKEISILEGTGTLVSLKTSERIPQHENLVRELSYLIPLGDIVREREIVVRDVMQERSDPVVPVRIEGKKVLSESFDIPGYERARAKLVVFRAKRPFERQHRAQFRQGGIQIKSRHGIHEATLFDPGLEYEPAAAVFFGRLTCHYIDDLWTEYDDRCERGQRYTEKNPVPILDPMRKQGLDREHPFTKELFIQALHRFRPLVEQEKKNRDGERKQIENSQTRARLARLEKEAAKFLKRHMEYVDLARETDDTTGSGIWKKGYAISPPFVQIVLGQVVRYSLQIKQEVFPELAVGDTVEIHCHTNEVSTSERYGQLEQHPTKEGILRFIWTIKGEKVAATTGIRVRAGSIEEDCLITVVGSEKDLYADLDTFKFNKKKYTIQAGGRRTLKVLAPYPEVISKQAVMNLKCDNASFKFLGNRTLSIRENLGIVEGQIKLECPKPGQRGIVTASIGDLECSALVVSEERTGDPIKIKLVDENFGGQRSRWRGNILEVGTRHPSLQRYLGPGPKYSGQEEKHFRVIIAEIVSDATCQKIIGKRVEEDPEEYNHYDWDAFYAEYSALMTEFLPIAHGMQVPN